MGRQIVLFLAIALVFNHGIFIQNAAAKETHIDVRVLSKGAKFIGTSMAGVAITISDVMNDTILAQGITEGNTGDTVKLMTTALTRNTPLSTPDSAVFTTTLDLQVPTLLEFKAFGPLSDRDSANHISVTQWAIPGKHLNEGDGMILHLPGFVVNISKSLPSLISKHDSRKITVHASVRMMCGCPITPGGLWDANQYEIAWMLYKNNKEVASGPLTYAGSASIFIGTITIPDSENYEIIVYAYDPNNGNTGIDKISLKLPT